MTKTRGAIYGVLICAGLALLWTRKHEGDKKVDQAIASTALPKADIARIVFSPGRHEIETVTAGPHGRPEIRKTFVGSSGASVDIGGNGSIRVNTRSWGTTLHPHVGLALGSDVVGRAAVGLDLFYVQRWELGGGLLLDSHIRDTRAYAVLNYNVYSSVLVGVAVDNKKTVHLMAGLKF